MGAHALISRDLQQSLDLQDSISIRILLQINVRDLKMYHLYIQNALHLYVRKSEGKVIECWYITL